MNRKKSRTVCTQWREVQLKMQRYLGIDCGSGLCCHLVRSSPMLPPRNMAGSVTLQHWESLYMSMAHVTIKDNCYQCRYCVSAHMKWYPGTWKLRNHKALRFKKKSYPSGGAFWDMRTLHSSEVGHCGRTSLDMETQVSYSSGVGQYPIRRASWDIQAQKSHSFKRKPPQKKFCSS